MYVQECLAREHHYECLRQAQSERSASQVVELQRLEKRRKRAERELLRAWQQVERLRSMLGAVG
jgi:hypothetical protein